MASKLHKVLDAKYEIIQTRIISIICQSLLYGICLCLAPIAVRAIVTNGLQSRSRKWLLAITISMFALSTLHWVLSVALTFVLVDTWNGSLNACFGSGHASGCIRRMMAADGRWLQTTNDILRINYIISDGVVVWRARVLCSERRRVVLMIPVVMLGINTVIYLMTVVLRAILLTREESVYMRHDLNNMIKGTHMTYQTLSLLINIFATSLIALNSWKHRRLLMESGLGIRKPTQAVRILGLLVESGMIYILLGVMSVASQAVLLSFQLGALSDLIMPVGIQLVGLYPLAILVALLVERNRSLDSKSCSRGAINDIRGGRPSQTKPMNFISGPESGDQIDSAVESPVPNTDLHATSDSA